MSKQVISTLKKRMTLEERKRFVLNCEIKNGVDWWKKLHNLPLMGESEYLMHSDITFLWGETKEGHEYWSEIFGRFTPEELSLTINLKEL